MQDQEILGLYERLKRELAVAYGELPWRAGRIDRLAAEINDVEKVLRTPRQAPGGKLRTRLAGRIPAAVPRLL